MSKLHVKSFMKKIVISVITATVLIGVSACDKPKEETEGISKPDFTEHYRNRGTNEIKIPDIVIDEIVFENIDESIFQKELPIYKTLKSDRKDGYVTELLDKFSFDSNYRIYERDEHDLYKDANNNELDYIGKGLFNFRINGYDYNKTEHLTANMSDDEAKAMAVKCINELKIPGDIVQEGCGVAWSEEDWHPTQKIVGYSRRVNDYKVMNINHGNYFASAALEVWLSDSGINMVISFSHEYEENGMYTTISKEKAIEKMLNFSEYKDVYIEITDISEEGTFKFNLKNSVKIDSAELVYFDDFDPSLGGFDVLPGYCFGGEVFDETGNSAFFYALVCAIE